jgi:predicted ABC-type ATPase
MQRVLRQAKDAGFAIAVVFIFLESPEACTLRVKERVRKGGHDVPENDILRRFYRSKQNFWRIYREEVDSWFLFYNSGAVFQPVAFGDGDNHEVTDEELFNLFLGDIET